MRSNTGPTPTTTKQQVSRYLIAGCSAVGIDFATYTLLHRWLSPALAKGVSFLLGSLVAYGVNKYWTFEKRSSSASEALSFGILYAGTLAANVGVNLLSLQVVPEAIPFAFLTATGTSTVLNFVGQKYWVFKP